jgi:aspartokinase-like uncharacterized kinase
VVVVKVGGSLYDLPDLGPRLWGFLVALDEADWLVVPGGGAAVDAVRALDRDHALGPGAAHWLALRACSVNAHFLLELLPGSELVADPRGHTGPGVLDSLAFAQGDEGRPGCLPHRWEATSDSLAARAAELARAELVLLKSVTIPPDASWEAAAAAGHVDPLFPALVRRAGVRARAVNLRDWP